MTGFIIGASALLFLMIYSMLKADKARSMMHLEDEYIHEDEVNNKKYRDLISDDIFSFIQALERQGGCIKGLSHGDYPENSRDRWSTGYVAGYAYTFAKAYNENIPFDKLREFTFLAFTAAYGDELGVSEYQKIDELIKQEDKDFHAGMAVAREDVLADRFSEESGRPFALALGWFKHSFPEG